MVYNQIVRKVLIPYGKYQMSQKGDNTLLPIWALLRLYKDKKQENKLLPSLKELLWSVAWMLGDCSSQSLAVFCLQAFFSSLFFSVRSFCFIVFFAISYCRKLKIYKNSQSNTINLRVCMIYLASTITGSQPISSCFKFHTSVQFAYYFEENSRFIISSVTISVCTLRGNGSLKHYKSKSAFIVFYSFFVLYLKVNKNNYQMLH